MLPRLIAVACLASVLSACGDDEQPDTGERPEPTATSSATTGATPAIGRGELPAGFPGDDVPLLTEALVGGAEQAGEFIVTFEPRKVDIAEERAVRLLARAGYEMVDEREQDGNSSSTLTNGTWTVTVAASSAGIIYLVSPAA